MNMLSLSLTLFVIQAPILYLVFLSGAGILFWRVRTLSTAGFFFGMLAIGITTIMPRLLSGLLGGEYSKTIADACVYISVIALVIQVVGLFFYALSVPKKNKEVRLD